MPQGVVIAVQPSLYSDYDWILKFVNFLKDNNGGEYKIGVIETCATDKEDGDIIRENERLLFIIPAAEFPDVAPGDSCTDPKGDRVRFFYRREPFKHIYRIDVH